jgi:hypothetical protein
MTTPEVEHQKAWTPDDGTFGARLALVRQRMGWGNVKEAADQCGLPPENWRRWERDGLEPRRLVTIAMAIATKTGCDFLWLVHGPTRGGAVRTTSFLPGARVIGAIGTERPSRNRPIRRSSVHNQPATRPVNQTRPLARESSRPRTPLAV